MRQFVSDCDKLASIKHFCSGVIELFSVIYAQTAASVSGKFSYAGIFLQLPGFTRPAIIHDVEFQRGGFS
ncbi:MAG: hypothetical protein KKB51_07825 [Candidatus Riflebacteria bacterium]|nr:hypothetical protein [Candidatus Riflebacteria bacterium]